MIAASHSRTAAARSSGFLVPAFLLFTFCAAQTTLASVKPENPLIPPVSIEPEAPIDVAVPDQGSSPSLPEYHGPSMATAHVLRSSAPDFPDYEIMQGHAGVVELRILIGTDGHARDVELAKTSGYPNLDKAALSAVRRWVFEAARRDGATIETWATLKVRFKLR